MVVKEVQHLPRQQAPPSVLAELRNIPWCSELLQNDTLVPLAADARDPKDDDEDSLIAETLKTKRAIPLWQYFYRKPVATSGSGVDDPWAELLLVVRLEAGLNGHPKLAHGGVISFIMDEAMTMLASMHRLEDQSGFTASLKIDYKKPLKTPCIALAKVFLLPESKGRKVWLKGSLEDGHGGVYAMAETLVVEVARDRVRM